MEPGQKTNEELERRIAKVRVGLELLSNILSGRRFGGPNLFVTTDAPPDLEVIGVGPSLQGYSAWLYCTSKTFDPVPDDEEPPPLEQFRYRASSLISLIEAYKNRDRNAFDYAQCNGCKSVFVDDSELYGSLKCPTPECHRALRRGLKANDVF